MQPPLDASGGVSGRWQAPLEAPQAVSGSGGSSGLQISPGGTSRGRSSSGVPLPPAGMAASGSSFSGDAWNASAAATPRTPGGGAGLSRGIQPDGLDLSGS